MKIKKLLSIILATVLLVGCIGLQVSAADTTATISLVGEKQAIVGAEYEVALNVKETSADLVGGISADVMYESAKFELKRVEISSDFATANSIDKATNTINTTTPGKIDIVLLDAPGDGIANDWLTFVFSVKESNGAAEFNLENVNVSDATGSKLITNNLTVDITDNSVYAHMIDVNGASIKKDGVGNIRFEAEIDSSIERSQIAAFGVMILPTAYIDNGDLKAFVGDLSSNDDTVKYTMSNGKNKIIARSYDTIDKLGNSDKFYVYLTNTTSFKLYTSFSARAYVVLNDKDKTVIYSDNKIVENDIVGGTSSKSCIDTAKAIYEKFKTSNDLSSISKIVEEKDATLWTVDEYKTVVAKLAECDYNG